MKEIIIIRHAKSSWKDLSLSDHDRPLNKRGKRDLPIMAERFWEMGFKPDIFYTSTATRARLTAEGFAQYENRSVVVEQVEHLYHASMERMLNFCQRLSDDDQSIALVGHNPGMTDLLNNLGNAIADNMPTCAFASFVFDVDKWSDILPKSGVVEAYEYPKKGRTTV